MRTAKPVGITSLRMRMACEPLVLWRWGGWFPVLIGFGCGVSAMFIVAVLNDLGRIRLDSPIGLFLWFLVCLPFLFTFQRTEFDNDDLIVRVSFWILIPLWRVSIPYAAVKGIGTDYHLVYVMPRPQESTIELYLYTRSRRAFLLSRHWGESSYQKAIEHIRKHVSFPILRVE